MFNLKLRVLKSIKPIVVNHNLPVNLIPSHLSFFKHLLSRTIPLVRVLYLRKVNLIAQGAIFKTGYSLKDLLLSNDQGLVVRYTFRDLFNILLFFPKQRIRNGSQYMLIDNVYSHTYYHWLTEALPRLFLIKEEIPNSVLLLPSTHKQKFHEESLRIFGVHRIEFLLPKIRYVIPDLIVTSQIGAIANYNPEIILNMVEYLKSRVDLTTSSGDKIYVSRQKANKRKVLNEDQLELYLKSQGFSVVCFEDYSFAVQVSIMSHCKFLVGIHGAGLANLIFMKPGGKVLELRKFDNGENYFYYTLASTVGQLYYYQFSETSDDTISVQDSNIVVDLEILKGNIQNMLLK